MPSTLHLHTFPTSAAAATAAASTIDSTTTQPMMAAAEMLPSLAEELARELASSCRDPPREMATAAKYHNHKVGPHQCCSAAVRRITAPVPVVWGLVRRFDQPQTYKHFLRSCRVIAGDHGSVGCLREVHVVSGLPATSSTERLEVLDEENHAIGFRVIGGEHRLQNYRSVTTLHPTARDDGDEEEGTVVVESYVVDVPPGNTKEETCTFVDTIVRCNLQSLSQIAQRTARSSSSSSSSTASSSSSSSTATSSSSCKVS